MKKKAGRPSRLSRREFLGLAGLGLVTLAAGGGYGIFSAEKRSSSRVTGYELKAQPLKMQLGGREVSTWGYNGAPSGEIRLKEGETLRATVANGLPESTTIHWHGVPVPNEMDGVPNLTQSPIDAGANFTYEFKAAVPGTYMYHSHAGLQLDRALYGPLIVEPADESLSYDREFVLMLDDWLDGVDGTPEDTMKTLKSNGSEMSDMNSMEGMEGMGGTSSNSAPDIVYPFYLINGKPADAPEELRVRRGEKVRLRLINPSSATIYRVALAGHRMSVTHADGQPVEPADADAVRIGMGERYDMLVEADNPGVWQLAAQAEGTSKVARAVFRYEESQNSPPPADFSPSELKGQMLSISMLKTAPEVNVPPSGEPDQVIPVTLDGDEKRYIWTINGQVFSEADPISIGRDQHVRFQFENKSMMPHPIHLHGHFFQVDNGTGRGPMKDTVLVEPSQQLAIDWVANNPGDWAFHCHMLYHQEAGMMRVVKVA